MKTLLFFLPTLGGGGAEMHTLRVVNHLDRSRYNPVVAVTRPGGSYEPMLAEGIALHALAPGVKSSTRSMLCSTKPLSRLIERVQPAFVLPVLDPSCGVAYKALRLTKTDRRPKLVCCIQNNFSVQARHMRFPLSLLLRSYRQAYAQADHVVALSRGVAEDLNQQIPSTRPKTSVVFNAAVDERMVALSQEPMDRPRPEGPLVVACGRLTRQKGFDDLLDAFAKVRDKVQATLWIMGAGPDEQGLRRRCAALGLDNAVEFLGFQNNPYRVMRAADLFVLSSRWEGFGMVVVEAMAVGTPVVSTDCPFGPAEILAGGEHGPLFKVGDVDAMARHITTLLTDLQELRSYADKGLARSNDFSAKCIADGYADVLDRLA